MTNGNGFEIPSFTGKPLEANQKDAIPAPTKPLSPKKAQAAHKKILNLNENVFDAQKDGQAYYHATFSRCANSVIASRIAHQIFNERKGEMALLLVCKLKPSAFSLRYSLLHIICKSKRQTISVSRTLLGSICTSKWRAISFSSAFGNSIFYAKRRTLPLTRTLSESIYFSQRCTISSPIYPPELQDPF